MVALGLVCALACERLFDFVRRCFFDLLGAETGLGRGLGSGPTVIVSFEMEGDVVGLRPRWGTSFCGRSQSDARNVPVSVEGHGAALRSLYSSAEIWKSLSMMTGNLNVRIPSGTPSGQYFLGWILTTDAHELSSSNNTTLLLRDRTSGFTEVRVRIR